MRIGLVGVGRIGALHAATLAGLDGVEQVVLADAAPGAAQRVAATIDGGRAVAVDDIAGLLGGGLDGLVVTTSTPGHGDLIREGVARGIPTFCEKPVAGSLAETIDLTRLVEAQGTPVHIGFQRRFDPGYRRARQAVESGEIGFVHTIRANTHDQAPPDPGYIPTSGGIFRDCNIHDFDAIRFVTGQEAVRVFATGGNKGADFFAEAGDVATGAAVLTLDDDTMVLVSSTRYNGGGHDVRMEVMGERGTITVGLDDSLAMTSAEPGASFPPGPQHWSFAERFKAAYVAELTTFLDVAAGQAYIPCTVRDGLQAARIAEAATESLTTGRPVALSDIPDA